MWRRVNEYESLSDGQRVRFCDGATGVIVIGSSRRSLVSFRADPRTGMSEERDWFNNTELEIEDEGSATG